MRDLPPKLRDPGAGKPYQPRIGREFEVEQVPTIEARTRGFLARIVASATVGAVAMTGIYGFMTGDHTQIEIVWAVAGPIVGAVIAHYFGPHRKDLP